MRLENMNDLKTHVHSLLSELETLDPEEARKVREEYAEDLKELEKRSEGDPEQYRWVLDTLVEAVEEYGPGDPVE